MRKDQCFFSLLNSTVRPFRLLCENPTSTRVTKKQCCCTVGQGWGDPCEPCPRYRTRKLIPEGT